MNKTVVRSLLLLGMVFLAACSAATSTPAPTPDLNALRTEVAATVLAQVPQICALTPTATFPPTNTATLTPSLTPTITSTEATLTPATTGTQGANINDKAKWVSQSIADGTTYLPGTPFTMTWQIQNVGTTTWTTAYRLRFYAGDPFGAPQEIALGKEVKPNETVDISIQMKAPAKAGTYRSDWVMSNEALRNFNEPLFLKITVATPTSTPTLTTTTAPTASATGQPSATPTK